MVFSEWKKKPVFLMFSVYFLFQQDGEVQGSGDGIPSGSMDERGRKAVSLELLLSCL